MHKKKDTTIFDASVERVVSEVLRWLAEDNPDFTIAAGDGEYVITEDDLLRDLTIFSEEVFDGERCGSRPRSSSDSATVKPSTSW